MSEDQTPYARLAASVQNIFGTKCKVAWLSGSFAYDGARTGSSDIDVVIVFERGVPAPADPNTNMLIRQFVGEYLGVHADHGFRPDLDFPGEFLTEALVEDAANGRGLGCDGSRGHLRLLAVESEEYWIDRPDRWARAWLSMIAFSRYLDGNRDYLATVKLCAWKTILKWVFLKAEGSSLKADDVFGRLRHFGLKERYRSFRAMEYEWVDRALSELAAEGLIRLRDGQITPLPEPLSHWQRCLCEELAASDLPPLLLDVEDTRLLSAYASKRWAAL